MPRRAKFNNAKKRWKTSALKLQHVNRWKISKDKCCACGKNKSNTVHLQIEKTSNEIGFVNSVDLYISKLSKEKKGVPTGWCNYIVGSSNPPDPTMCFMLICTERDQTRQE